MKSADKKTTQKTTFKVNQEIVYPLQGVGKVLRIEERPFKEEMLLYYIIYLEVSDMTVMVPVDKAEELGIRAIVSKPESEKALKLISEDYEPVSTDWKLRYQMNLDLLKSGSVMDIATVVRTLYHRSKIKELPILERKLFDNALKLLVDEVSFSINKSKEDVEALVFSRLESR
ncbi:MAG: CarD family transcriptional regulator [Spirochaetales bacterium]|nr:CarD family transcriptional regulator [Spirochaetales bacterium]